MRRWGLQGRNQHQNEAQNDCNARRIQNFVAPELFGQPRISRRKQRGYYAVAYADKQGVSAFVSELEVNVHCKKPAADDTRTD